MQKLNLKLMHSSFKSSLLSTTKVFFRYTLLTLFALVTLSSCKSLQDTSLAPGRKAPQLELYDLNGNTASLDAYLGKPLLINFLASWCKPCADEMPELEEFYQTYGDRVQVVAIGVEDDDAALREFQKKHKVTFPFLHDRTGNSKVRYRIGGYPETFLLDKEGKIQFVADPEGKEQFSLKYVGPRKWMSESVRSSILSISK